MSAAFSWGSRKSARSRLAIPPSGVTTALPSSQPPNRPSSQAGSRPSRLLAVQLVATSRSASTGADSMKDRKLLPQPPGPITSSNARHKRPACSTTGTGAQ